MREVRLSREGATKTVTGKHNRCSCEACTGQTIWGWQGDRLVWETLSHLRKAAGGAGPLAFQAGQVEVPDTRVEGRPGRVWSYDSQATLGTVRKLPFFELRVEGKTTPDG